MKAYILIEALMGRAGRVTDAVRNLEFADATLLAADTVTGPFDVIVVVEARELDVLIQSVTDRIQEIDGVERTITCVA